MAIYTAIEPSCDTVNGAMSRQCHGMPTNPIVHDTLANCQPRFSLLHMFGSTLTVVPARFADYEKLGVDSVGKQADHETK